GRDFVKPGNLIGNGAYTLASWRINDRIVLTRNARYHSANQVGFDKVEWIPEENETEEFNLFRTDELDLTASTPTALHQRLTVDYPEALQVAPILTAYFYVFDLTEPPLGDVRLREALALAVDRETLTTAVTSAGQVPAFGLVPPGIPGYTAFRYAWADWPRAAQLARARELYAAAGYSDERPLKARLLYNNAAAHEKIAVAVQAMLRDSLGAEIELVSQEFKVMLQNRSVRDAWDLMRLGWTGDYNDANTFLETFQSNHPQNTPRFADDAYDATLVAAATELDPEERQQKLNAAEGILMRQYPILPLYFNVSRHLVSPRITGFKSNVRDRIYSRHLRPANSDDTP
ncbi:MAG: peptide ABC transporter substrate-binding protein, partial [Pseudomonadota bacterium]